MPERTASDAVLRFVEDLKSLRLQQNVTLDDIRNATRVPLDVLETFEGSVLQGNRLFNQVYLRSLVRAYASTITLNPDRAIDALERALEGEYDGQLLREPEEEPQPEQELVESEAATPPLPERTRSDEPEPQRPTAYEAPPPAPRRTVYEEHRPGTNDPADQPAPEPVPVEASWDAVSGSNRNPRARSSTTPWGLILTAVAVLVIVGGGIVWWLSRSPAPPDGEDERVAVADTVVQQAPPPAPVTPVSLPDTLTLQLTAKTDADSDGIQDIKVQVDDDFRRPYWLEKGESRNFRFVNRITVEQQLSDATLTLEGRPFPTTQTDASGRIVIDRDAALRHLQGR